MSTPLWTRFTARQPSFMVISSVRKLRRLHSKGKKVLLTLFGGRVISSGQITGSTADSLISRWVASGVLPLGITTVSNVRTTTQAPNLKATWILARIVVEKVTASLNVHLLEGISNKFRGLIIRLQHFKQFELRPTQW